MARQFSMLQYDIPERQGNDKIPNPSGPLRPFCVRTSYSVWIVPQDRIPWPMLNRWTEQGVRWHLVPFSATDEGVQQVLALSTDALRRELAGIEASVQKSLNEAATKYGIDSATYERRARAIITRGERLIAAAQSAAQCFGIANDLPTGETRTRVQGMQAANQQLAATYVAMAATVQGTELAVAAQDGDVPVEVMADFIADQTGADMSQTIAAFQQSTAPVAVAAGTGKSHGLVGSWGSPNPSNVGDDVLPQLPTPVATVAPPASTVVRPQRPQPHNGANDQRCPRCQAALTAPKQGRRGWFRGCSRFPACRGLVNV